MNNPAAPAGPLNLKAIAGRLRQESPNLGLTLSEPVIAQLVEYLALLNRWNRAYNLTAIRDPERMVTHHLFDSLAVISPLEHAAGVQPKGIVDIGSGAGLPGLILAIIWRDVPVWLVEPVDKKCAFLRQVVAQLKLENVRVVADRVQNLSAGQFAETNSAKTNLPGIFICRAYTRLAEFAQQVAPLVQPGDLVAAMKSAIVSEEVSELLDVIKTNSQSITNEQNNCRLTYLETTELLVPGVDAARSLVFLSSVAGIQSEPAEVSS